MQISLDVIILPFDKRVAVTTVGSVGRFMYFQLDDQIHS